MVRTPAANGQQEAERSARGHAEIGLRRWRGRSQASGEEGCYEEEKDGAAAGRAQRKEEGKPKLGQWHGAAAGRQEKEAQNCRGEGIFSFTGGRGSPRAPRQEDC